MNAERIRVPDSVGYGLNPGVELAPLRSLLSNSRDRRARKNLRNVADTGRGGGRRCCQGNGRVELVRGRYGPALWIRTMIGTVHLEPRGEFQNVMILEGTPGASEA